MAMPEEATSDLEELRGRAFAIGYRMLGSVADAEDVAQESLIRYHAAVERDEVIDAPPAYVATVATRLAIDELRSARARRETYHGEWLPEPLPTSTEGTTAMGKGDTSGSGPGAAESVAAATGFPDPAAHAELADSLSLAFLVLLEKLTPEQRAALLLHDVFGYSHEEVADVIGGSEARSRQLASRARRLVGESRPTVTGAAERQQELANRFFEAVETGDLGGLESMLAEDVVLRGDGGGKVPALARPLRGRSRTAKALSAWSRFRNRMPATSIEPMEFNGQPGAIFKLADGHVLGALTVETDGERITAINSVVNPDKLGHLGDTVPNYGELIKRTRD